jgi:feruloyl-CoA synthase
MIGAPGDTFKDARVLPPDIVVRRDPDGTIRAHSPHPLGPYPERLTEKLDFWAATAPERCFLAERGAEGAWKRLTYGEARTRVRRIAQALIDRRLSSDRTLLILSGNSIEHALLALAAMYAGVPYAPAAPAYSLLVNDHSTLGKLVETMRPGLIFAGDGVAFEPALRDVAGASMEVVTSTPPRNLRATPVMELETIEPTGAVDDAHRRVNAATVAKVLFTSGSTGRPKAVINTQRMLCSNQEQICTVMAFLRDAPPTLCDWLPWNHTFGGNHNFGIVLYNGGTLYIDEGRPVPGQMDRTIANLRDVATTAYFNVPRGFELLLPVLREDESFRRHFFSQARAMFFAAATLRPEIADGMQQLAIASVGRPVPWITGLGSTESAPLALCTGPLLSTATHVGVPAPGLELKVVPIDGVFEARLRGPNITPGYWRDEDLSRELFDEEGFYKMGDAIAPVDPDDPLVSGGFAFRGRVQEDFKLSTGTWVRVGPLRARLLAELGDIALDVVVAGHGRECVAVLIFPNLPVCRTLADGTPAASLLADARVRSVFAERLARYNAAHPGSSTSIFRALLLDTPPSLEAMEITDKGSINQRAVLTRRQSVVEELWSSVSGDVLL